MKIYMKKAMKERVICLKLSERKVLGEILLRGKQMKTIPEPKNGTRFVSMFFRKPALEA